MSYINYLIGCPHFGHDNICKFLRGNGLKVRPFDNAKQMDDILIENWNGVVRPKDRVYVLGDVAFDPESLSILNTLHGEKILIKGNHDVLPLHEYVKYFKDIRATHKMANTIFSHIPIHSDSLGQKFDEESGMWTNKWYNIHAHLHAESVMKNGVPDPKYFSVCVEHIEYTPISFDVVMIEIKKRVEITKKTLYE